MIICHDLRMVFLHIPKCAGTALRTALENVCNRSSIVSLFDFDYSHRLRRHVDLAHLPLDDFRHFPEWRYLKKYQTIACIRHPYKRLASACREYYRQKSRLTQQQMKVEPPSESQISSYFSALPAAIEAHDIRYIHAFPIVRFTHYGTKPMVDFILRSDHLAEDIRELPKHCALTSRQCESIIQQLSESRNAKPSPSLQKLQESKALRATANLIYREDFSTFGFKSDSQASIENAETPEQLAACTTLTESHEIPYLSFAPRVRWYWGRNSITSYPPMRPTRSKTNPESLRLQPDSE